MSDSRTRIPSPARSVGAILTPKRHKNPRKTRSVCSPARSNASGRLSALIQEHKNRNSNSNKMSPLVRRSVLSDNTEIDEPGNASWWKNLKDESRDVMEVLKDNDAIQPHNVMEELNLEVLSQEEKHFTLDILDSSDSESINSIIIPQRKFFHEKENHPQKQFEQFGTRETLDKLHKSNAAAADKTVTAGTKKLFQAQPRSRPVFPAALLDISTNTSASDNTLAAALRPKAGIRNLLGNQQASKRKNMFAKFIESDTEDEISDIPEVKKKFFDVQKSGPTRRPSARSSSSKFRDHSPTSNVTSDSFADWDHLPSSTMMVDNQLEAVMASGQKAKRSKLSKLSEADTTSTKSDKTKLPDKSAVTDDLKSKTMSKEKSLQQNTYIVTKNHSTVTQEAEGQLNKSQEAQNKSYPSPSNISQTSMTSRSKNKSVLGKVPDISLNKSRNTSFKTKDTSKTSKSTDNRVNKSIAENYSVSKHVRVMNADENELKDPAQNNDDEVDVAKKSKHNFSKNVSVTKNAIQKEDITEKNNVSISISSKNLQTTVNEVVEESRDVTDNHDRSHLLSHNDERNENEENVDNQMDIDKTETTYPNKIVGPNEIVEKAVINENKEPQNIQHESIEKCNNSANVSPIKGSEVDNIGDGIQNKNQTSRNASIEIQDTSANKTKEKNIDIQDEILHRESLNIQDQHHDQSETEGDNNDIKEQSQKIIQESDEEDEEEQDESKNNKVESEEENSEIENDQNESKEQSEIENIVDDGEELNISEEKEDDENEKEKENESQEEQNKSQEEQNEIEKDLNAEQDENESEAEKNESDEEIEAEKLNSTQKELNESSVDIAENTQSESEDNNEDTENDDSNASMEDANESIRSANISVEDANESAEKATAESDQEVESDQEQENNESNLEPESDQDANDQNDDDNQIDNTETPNVSHDTTGRNRIKNPERTLEVGLFSKSRVQDLTCVGSGRNTSIRKTKSIVHPNIAQAKSISLVASGENSKESVRLSGPGNSSAEGSGWDSHRTTRKTLRQTFGKDFTPRKSLRAMVMEKSAKRHTLAKDTTSAVPIANSTEFGDPSMDHGDYEMDDEPEESVHEVSLRTRTATLEKYLQKIKKDIAEEQAEIEASVTRQLQQRPKDPLNPFKVPARPMFPRRAISKPKPKTKPPVLSVPLENLPKEFLQDIKYKPPKRFCPRNAPWLTKHFYKYVETKLEPKYDYKARVRAEKFAQTLHGFVQDNRRKDFASPDAVDTLKREMARLNIVQTHSDFYNFFWKFMPKEIQLKVIPMLYNRMPLPRDMYSNILENSAHG